MENKQFSTLRDYMFFFPADTCNLPNKTDNSCVGFMMILLFIDFEWNKRAIDTTVMFISN